MYELLSASDATGGNGHDTVYGFTEGNVNSNANADRIDISELLGNYHGTAGLYLDEGGVPKLDSASEELLNFVKLESVGNDTVLSVDRDGSGSEFGFTNLVTLKDVNTDLLTLLQNHQILV
ncbi:hypothetical protein D9M68_823650 [compost metagenome]